MDPLAGMAVLAGLTFGFVVGRLRAVLLPLAVLGAGAVAQQITLSSRGHWTSTEAEIVGASFLAVFAVLAGVGIRELHSRYYKRPGPPSPPFAPLPPRPTDRAAPDARRGNG